MSRVFAEISASSALFRKQSPTVDSSVQTLPTDLKRHLLVRCGKHFAVMVFLFCLCWVAHFTQSRNIGFYSDDHTFSVHMLSWSTDDFKNWLRTEAMQYPEPQGRPLGFILGVALPYFGNRLAGVEGMFIIGWIILSTNALLLYYLLRRCFAQPLPFLAAVSFLLFPGDTTRSFLCHLHILQPSLTFMLIAAHLYLRGNRARRMLAYFVVTLCLLTYETALLPFLAVPLLERSLDRTWRRRFVIHIFALFLVIAFVGFTRQFGGEYRAVEAAGSKWAALFAIVAGSIIGPCVVGAACFWRMVTGVIYMWNSPQAIGILAVGSAALGMAIWLCIGRAPAARTTGDPSHAILFGVGATFVSYILCFTHFPPYFLTGQLTSVHVATAVGGSTLMAAAGCVLLWFKPTVKWKILSSSIIAIYMGLLLVNAQGEQAGFVKIWAERRQFWTRVLDLCPDLTDRTLIICDGELPQPNKMMWATSWSDYEVLSQVYQFPAGFTLAPALIPFASDAGGKGWRSYVSRNSQGRALWSKPVVGLQDGAELVEGNTILLQINANGEVSRATGTLDVAGKPFQLKALSAKASYPTLPFYNILVDGGR